jgi:hypothetical protein
MHSRLRLLPHPNLTCPPLLLRDTHLPQTHIRRALRHTLPEINLGPELLALPRLIDQSVQFINLLEREAFCLVDQCPDEDDCDQAAATPDEEDFGL